MRIAETAFGRLTLPAGERTPRRPDVPSTPDAPVDDPAGSAAEWQRGSIDEAFDALMRARETVFFLQPIEWG